MDPFWQGLCCCSFCNKMLFCGMGYCMLCNSCCNVTQLIKAFSMHCCHFHHCVIRISIDIPTVSHFDTKVEYNTAQAMAPLTENSVSLSRCLNCKILHYDFGQPNTHSILTLVLDSSQINNVVFWSCLSLPLGMASEGMGILGKHYHLVNTDQFRGHPHRQQLDPVRMLPCSARYGHHTYFLESQNKNPERAGSQDLLHNP